MPEKRRCSAIRKDGRPCQAWATRDSDPPRCPIHAKSEGESAELAESVPHPGKGQSIKRHAADKPGFYAPTYTREELTDLFSQSLDHSLNGEVAAARVVVRRILQQLEQELSPAEYARLASLIFTGTNTIARLMQAQQALSEKLAGEIAGVMTRALEEMERKGELEFKHERSDPGC